MIKIRALVLSALVSTTLMAEIKPYVGAGFGLMATPDYSGAKNAIGMTLKAGATGFIEEMQGIGVLFELNKSLTDLSSHKNAKDALTFGGYISYDIVVPNSSFAIRPKFGIIIPNASDEINSRDLTFSSGIGGKIGLNEQVDIYVDYVVLGEMVTHYSAGVEFKF
ncbi:MAG: hypothetical protein U9N52_00695 [Campylobacterota bacterium]|nr:hypothetical protein [Campylobacterota bacterium]